MNEKTVLFNRSCYAIEQYNIITTITRIEMYSERFKSHYFYNTWNIISNFDVQNQIFFHESVF